MKREWKKELPKTRNYFIPVVFISLVFVTTYPTIIYPMLHPDTYRNIQKETRKGINQEDIQPGNMKVWSDPFNREKK